MAIYAKVLNVPDIVLRKCSGGMYMVRVTVGTYWLYLLGYCVVLFFSVAHPLGFFAYLAASVIYAKAAFLVTLQTERFLRGAWSIISLFVGGLIIQIFALNGHFDLIPKWIVGAMLPTAVWSWGVGFFCGVDLVREFNRK